MQHRGHVTTRSAVALILFLYSIGLDMASARLSPVTRVAELLQGLAAKIEMEAKAEEVLYNKFVCWGTSNVNTKTASNAASESRISSLNTYIADLDAGRIELTTERVDLEKEIAQLSNDLETAAAQRAKERADFEDAKKEMDQGIAALTDGIRVLGEATQGAQGNLLAVRGKLRARGGFAARSAEAVAISRAVDLGKHNLAKGDAEFLRRVLTGDVPVWDWKKLNRKADFKMKYSARSEKIQKTLAKLLQTFQTNLAEATQKEEAAQALHDKLAASKGAQKDTAAEALRKMEKENGARGMSRADAQAEAEALTTQVADDTKFIEQLQGDLERKKGEWKDRTEIRANELAAISEAIATLRSDDSRDLFKKSFASQGYMFLQLQRDAASGRSFQAASVMQLAARAAGSARVGALAARVLASTNGHFDPVLAAIDTMVEKLKGVEETELKQKEQCEAERAADTRSALVTSRTIDEMTDKITSLQAEIKELDAEIEEKNENVKTINGQLKEAARQREDGASAYGVAKKDDDDAVALITQARTVLQRFYTGLVQTANVRRQPATSAAGEAPPPPPSTWDGGYGGKSGESNGIISILTVILEDVQKDIAKATTAEENAIKDYTDLKAGLEKDVLDLQNLISTLQGTKSGKEAEIESTESEQITQKEGLKVVMKKLEDAREGCDFISVNFPVRTSNRQIEIDGLLKAKAVLNGADFSEAPALVQRKPLARGLASRTLQ